MSTCGVRRSGYVLLTVLWVLVGTAAIGSSGMLAARYTVSLVSNRIAITRAAWRAEACVEGGLAHISHALSVQVANAWATLDTLTAYASLHDPSYCTVELRPGGMAVNVNGVEASMLRRLMRSVIDTASADSLTDAVLDWIDEDTVARARGAEAGWYRRVGRPTPRDGPIGDVRELSLVRGFEQPVFYEVLGAEDDRILIGHAPAIVIRSLPGMSYEAVGRMEQMRRSASGTRLIELIDLIGVSARDSLQRHYAELSAMTTDVPEAWYLIGRASFGAGTAVQEAKLAFAGSRAAIVRRRRWLE